MDNVQKNMVKMKNSVLCGKMRCNPVEFGVCHHFQESKSKPLDPQARRKQRTYFSALTMEAVRSFETVVDFYRNTRHHENPG
jgi:hypothetical protein